MVRKRVFEEMPVFFAYSIFQVVRALVLLGVRTWASPSAYSYSYWLAEGTSAIIGLLVINEIFTKVLCRYDGIRYISKMLFRWAFAILILLAFVAAMSPPSEKTPGLIAAVLSLERSVRIVQCGLLLLLFIFSSALSVSWLHYTFGIALGFGIYAAVEVMLVSTRIQAGASLNTVYILLKPGAYMAAILVWWTYLVLPVPSQVMPKFRRDDLIGDWNEAILGMLRQ